MSRMSWNGMRGTEKQYRIMMQQPLWWTSSLRYIPRTVCSVHNLSFFCVCLYFLYCLYIYVYLYVYWIPFIYRGRWYNNSKIKHNVLMRIFNGRRAPLYQNGLILIPAWVSIFLFIYLFLLFNLYLYVKNNFKKAWVSNYNHYMTYDYSFMMGSKLIHVSKWSFC